MADTLLSFGVEKLWDFLVRESDRLKGMGEQLNELKRDLNFLRSFLKDADAKKHASAMVRNCVEEIKDIVFDAEDVMETFLLKEELGRTSGLRNRMRGLAFSIVDRRELASDMEGISKRISKVISDMKGYGVEQIIVDGNKYLEHLQERQREMRHTFSSSNESNLVGLEQNVMKLVSYLVEEDSIQVVSITGMGGIGKTTIAQQVFNHEMVKSHFRGVAWVCISQQFTRKYVWQTILQKLSSKTDEHVGSNMTEDELQETLFRLLETSKSLIVLDDMWKEEDWDRIKHVFPPTKGWKVLITSRNERVALHADPTCTIFKQECLNPEESWTLFQRIAFPRKDTTKFKVDVEMEEMGMTMVKQCGGLPLAIRVLGGLLAAQHTLTEWKRVSSNIGSFIVGGIHVLNLSFEELPVYLKHCFLYLAYFQNPIDVEKLSYYWAAEGILWPQFYDGATIREVAEGCIEELVKRNMVVSERGVSTSRFETCHLHDVMRGVCMRKAEEENFVQVLDAKTINLTANSASTCKPRRLLVDWPGSKFNMEVNITNPKLRSLMFITMRPWLRGISSSFTTLKLMRLLDFSGIGFEGWKLPSSIGLLIHLKYLSLCGTGVSHLPSSLRNLKLLLYLNLHVNEFGPIYMSGFLVEMRELRYLFLPMKIQDGIKLQLANLINLETLENFSTKNSNVTDLQRMTRLVTLSISLNGGCTLETLSSSLYELSHLEHLAIDGQKMLHLYEHRHGERQLCGKKMVCSRGGFPRLQVLKLCELVEWEEWVIEEGSMPILHTIEIHRCEKLKELPDGLRFVTKLKEVNITACKWELKEKLSKGGEDYYKVKHIPCVLIDYTRLWEVI